MKAKGLFPSYKLGVVDYLIGGLLLLGCFFSFFQDDIYITGSNSLNYLFGNPLDFYDNCKKIQGHGLLAVANYPPSIFIIFASWLYPFKLLGLIKSPLYFPIYLVYWLKILTSIVYVATGFVFYRVSQIYIHNKNWGNYVTWLWLTTPLAIFSQFIFSQYDIFYVFLSLYGFLSFLKRDIYFASVLFGLAITFKYFPFFVFIPLLFFFEKKIIKVFINILIFLIPILIIQVLYRHSPAYIEGVMGFSAIGRIFSASLDIGGLKIYYIFAILTLLSGLAYYLDVSKNIEKNAAYLFLISSLFPFLFISWHPQWLLFLTPAIVLTTALSAQHKINKLLIIDLFAMLPFIAYVTLVSQNNVDLAMFQAKLLHIPFENSHNIGKLFKFFKGFSSNVYLSIFWGYLLLQCFIKYTLILHKESNIFSKYSYQLVRLRYYIGIAMFLVPAILIFYLNYKNMGHYLINITQEKNFGELTSKRSFEQTFVSPETRLTEIDLLLATFSRINHKILYLEILNKNHKQLGLVERSAIDILDNSWESFYFSNIKLKKGEKYILRLTSPESTAGNAITWWASAKASYKNGIAIVDGIPQNSDFSFRIKFEKTA